MYKNNTPTVNSKGIQDLIKIDKYCNGRMKKALHVYIEYRIYRLLIKLIHLFLIKSILHFR